MSPEKSFYNLKPPCSINGCHESAAPKRFLYPEQIGGKKERLCVCEDHYNHYGHTFQRNEKIDLLREVDHLCLADILETLSNSIAKVLDEYDQEGVESILKLSNSDIENILGKDVFEKMAIDGKNIVSEALRSVKNGTA